MEYEELPKNTKENADALYDTALECFIEDMMYDYKEYGSIQGDYTVKVKQV